ncbi:DUF986 family protein [Musicola paradisiaca]|uniref:UPF0266 membrane protein Dd703_2024 n=1 Tax=Musicola paradisiaca (strain Ech703) TaxID=579405 RepID=C6C623_MUSP7|nr:DUF986 family protein [Musicola paradisiaca]ACS85814.1 protein of unknown function DUF986 [Musicola paradisiaca Ech703]
MSLTDITLCGCLLLALAYAVYDEFIMDRQYGHTCLKVFLRRTSYLDAVIFVVLVAILIYKNVTTQGTLLTTVLLFTLVMMAIYLSIIRQPKLLFKEQGFFYANTYIPYHRIKAMNLSEDGILVIDLEQRRIFIAVKKLDDLDKIYKFIIEIQ